MKAEKLKKRYDELVADIESMPLFDGRNKGIDVYVCEKCGKQFYTRYKDKGVTPFTIRCRREECGAAMIHRCTISVSQAKIDGLVVHNWVRPTFEQLQKLSDGAIDHVLNGGLMLEDELHDDRTETTNRQSITRKEEIQVAAANYVESWYKERDMVKEDYPMDAQISEEDFAAGAVWADKTMIGKALNWLKEQEETVGVSFQDDFYERFKQAMGE